MTDPVADFLTRIRNGLHADRDDVEMPASNLKAEIARILQEQGYIDGYDVEPAFFSRSRSSSNWSPSATEPRAARTRNRVSASNSARPRSGASPTERSTRCPSFRVPLPESR